MNDHDSTDNERSGSHASDSHSVEQEKARGALDGARPEQVSEGPVLPPVEAPSGAFIVQLFLIPLIIVGIIVTIWMGIGWLAHAETDPHRLAENLTESSTESWQKAYTLSTLLRSGKYDHLKEDAKLCQTLTRQLESQLKLPASTQSDVQLRVYLCRVVGQFRLPQVIPPLLDAARASGNQPYPVRLAAVEGLSTAAQAIGPEKLDARGQIVDALIGVTKEPPTGAAEHEINELHATGAYALGVLGGPKAVERLVVLLDAGYPNTRYNAATGLAWHGRAESVPVLLEMLDPKNPFLMVGELTRADAARKVSRDAVHESRRNLVMASAIRATTKVLPGLSKADRSRLQKALQHIVDGQLPRPLKLAAKEALVLLEN